MPMLRRTTVTLVGLLLLLTGCSLGGDDEEDRTGGRETDRTPPALVAAAGPKQCLPPGRHLYFQLVRARERVRISYHRSGVRQVDLAQPRPVETLRMWVATKPKRFKPTGGTRPWPYGMGRVASSMTGWDDSWDPTVAPGEQPRYLTRGWSYVFVLIEGRHASRADIRLGWATRAGREGEVAIGRKVWFNKRCAGTFS